MIKIKTLYSLGAILPLLVLSLDALAHSGMEHSENMHSIMHMFISISVGLALLAAGFFLLKRFPNVTQKLIRQRVKK